MKNLLTVSIIILHYRILWGFLYLPVEWRSNMNSNKLGLMTDEELDLCENITLQSESLLDTTGNDDKKGQKAALAAAPAAAVFLPAAPEAAPAAAAAV